MFVSYRTMARMVTGLQISPHADMPIYRQIVTQIALMIETGALAEGDRLPSSRLLADNLQVNRNTVAKAYGELRDQRLVESRRRGGMVVLGSTQARLLATSAARARARDVLEPAVREALALGLEVGEVHALVTAAATAAAGEPLRVSFIECNQDRASAFATDLSQRLDVQVTPLVLGDFEPSGHRADLILTTFYHLAQVRTLDWGHRPEVVAIVVAPHVRTLVQLARLPAGSRIGIRYASAEQARSLRDSLTQSGITEVRVLEADTDADLVDVDVVVVPTERPDLKEPLIGRVPVIEYGNVLDEASVRMVREVLRDLTGSRPAGGRDRTASVAHPKRSQQ